MPSPTKKPVLGQKKKKEAENSLQNDAREKKFWKLVTESVPYSQFLDLKPTLKVNWFLEMRTLAVLDLFWDLKDEEIVEKLGVEQARLWMLRSNPHYQAVCDVVAEAARSMAKPRTLDEWARDTEDRVAADLYLIGTGEGLARDRVAALTAFADRRSAKKGREPEAGGQMMVPGNLVQAIQFVMNQGAVPALEGGVDGGVLNVPRREETKRLPAPPEEN